MITSSAHDIPDIGTGLRALVDDLVAPTVPGSGIDLPQQLERSGSPQAGPPSPLEAAPAAVAAVADPDGPLHVAAAGRTIAFDADGALLDDREAADRGALPVSPDTVFDMASVTKVVTTLTVATLARDGLIDLDAPAERYVDVPDAHILVRHLLTHTAGLPPVMDLCHVEGGREERFDAIARTALRAAPGTHHDYSCIGFLLLGRICETVGGAPLPVLARERVLAPAGADTAGWMRPVPEASQVPSTAEQPLDIAATEYQDDPPRGLVQGTVHDETAWATGGVGNAGLFASVSDMIAIGRVLAGVNRAVSIPTEIRRQMSTDRLPGIARPEGADAPSTGVSWAQGLGLRVGQALPDGRVLPRVLGHPGFTGTSVSADPDTGRVAVLLTNRVHPWRSWFTVERSRPRLAEIAFGRTADAAGSTA
jgi:CubicO group peptidase (beta-lactamase class C family)